MKEDSVRNLVNLRDKEIGELKGELTFLSLGFKLRC